MSKIDEENIEARKKRLAAAFSEIRGKTGLSLAAFGKELGFAGASSIQRYSSASDHRGQYLSPELIQKMLDTLPGRYNVTRAEILQLADPLLDPSRGSGSFLVAAGEALRQVRKQRGYSIRQLADAADVSTTTVEAWEEGNAAPSSPQLSQMARLLKVDAAELASARIVPTDDEPLGNAVFISGREARFAGPHDVEKLGVVAAGDGDEFEFDGTIEELVARPRGLMGRPGVFSLEVISESMYPAYRRTDVVFCDRIEPQIGDDVVIETFPVNGAVNGKAHVKRLKRRTEREIIVEQFNPPMDLSFDRYAVKHLWRVVPNRELHGY
jgi:phage repressor protein C with HTH and peptisase S24 domain